MSRGRQVVIERDVIHLGRHQRLQPLAHCRRRRSRARDRGVVAGVAVSLGDVPDGYEKIDNPPIDVEDSLNFWLGDEVFGAERGADSLWRLPPLRAEFSAPHAALHLGPINIVLEVAAMEAAADDVGTDASSSRSWHVMMERPGVTGPFRAEARVNGAASSRIAVAATLLDEGKDDRAISTSMAIFHVCGTQALPGAFPHVPSSVCAVWFAPRFF